MTAVTGFFDSQVSTGSGGELVYDRAVSGEYFALYWAKLVGNGVYPNPSTNHQIVAKTGLTLTLKAGFSWINGYFRNDDTDYDFTLSDAPTTYPRIDRVVLRWDNTTLVRDITVEVLEGTPATSPVAPDLTRTSTIYEIALADVYVAKNVTEITQANITDQRLNGDVCGVMTGLIEQVDTTTLYDQIQADLAEFKASEEADFSTWASGRETTFDAWFQNLQDQLDENQASHLQNEVDAINAGSYLKTTFDLSDTPKAISHYSLSADSEFTNPTLNKFALIITNTTYAITWFSGITWLFGDGTAPDLGEGTFTYLFIKNETAGGYFGYVIV